MPSIGQIINVFHCWCVIGNGDDDQIFTSDLHAIFTMNDCKLIQFTVIGCTQTHCSSQIVYNSKGKDCFMEGINDLTNTTIMYTTNIYNQCTAEIL